jgi:hypothetical protein
MLDENGSLTDETTVTETPASEVQSISPEAAPAGGQQPAQQPTPQEILDYTKDERSKRMWFNPKTKSFDPNLMYKSIRSGDEIIEKKYKPLQAQADTFTKLFKDYGHEADPEKLKSAFEKLKTWEDPENPVVKRANFFSYFYDNPKYKQAIETQFEDYRRQELQAQFPGMNDEQIQKQIALETRLNELEMREKKQIEAKQHQELVGTINQGWERVQSECKNIGFPVTEEIRVGLLDECAKENVDPRFVFYKFMDMYKEEVGKYQRAKIQAEQMKTISRTRKSGIIPASSTQSKSTSASTAQKPSMVDRVMSNLGLKT